MYAASDGKYALLVVNDSDPLNPRVDCNTLGRMVCWHSRYQLGDPHDYDEPKGFLSDLYRRSIHDHGRNLVAHLKNHQAQGAYLEYNRSTHEWDLYVRNWWKTVLGGSEPDWEVVQSVPNSQLNDSSLFFDDMLDALTVSDLAKLLEQLEDVVLLPLYLYDHTIQSMSTTSFLGRAQHAEWDSGQVGYIYASRDAIEKEYGAVTKDSIAQAEEVLTGEVSSFDCYLRGECYGFRLYEMGEEIDSCWGFLGELNDLRENLRCTIPEECRALVDQLEWTCESEDAYLRKHDAA